MSKLMQPGRWCTTFDANGNFITTVYDEAFRDLLGYGPGEYSDGNEAWNESIHPDDVERVEAYFADVCSKHPEGMDYDIEYRMMTKRGYRWFHDCAHCERQEDGTIVRCDGFVFDIQEGLDKVEIIKHEQLRSDILDYMVDCDDDPVELLKAFAKRLRVLIDCDQVIYRDLQETRIMDNSSAIEKTWSVPEEFCRQCEHFDAHHPMYKGGYTEMSNCQEGWQGIPVYKDCPIKSSLTRIVYCDGEIAGYLAIHYIQKYHEFTDVERATLEEFARVVSISLSRYEAKKRAGEVSSIKKTLSTNFVLSDQFDPIMVLDPVTGEYDWMMSVSDNVAENTAMNLHGTDFYKDIGVDTATIIHEDNRESFRRFYSRENMMKVVETGKIQETENRWFIKTEGRYRWKYNKVVRMTDDNGKAFVVIGVIDTTESKKQEEEYRAQQILSENSARMFALEDDFQSLYDVNLETGHAVSYVKGDFYRANVSDKLPEINNYFDDLRSNIDTVIYEEDRDALYATLTREGIRKGLEAGEHIDHYYRLKTENGPMWFKIRIVYKDAEKKNVIIGVFDAKEDMALRERMDRIIAGFAKEYELAILQNLATGLIRVITGEDLSDPKAAEVLKNENPTAAYAENFVHPDDRHMFYGEMLTEKAVREKIPVGKSYSFEYRHSLDGHYLWYRAVIDRIGEDEVLIGYRNCDEEVLQRHFSEKIVSDFASVFIVNLKEDTYRFVSRNSESGFADVPGGVYSETIREYISRVNPEYREYWYRACDLDDLRERLKTNSRLEYEYPLEGVEKRWRRSVIQVLDSEDGVPVSFVMTFFVIDDTTAENHELASQIEKQKAKTEESLAFTNFFLGTYRSAYYINLKDLSYQVYKRPESVKEKYLIPPTYTEALSSFIGDTVHPDDREELIDYLHPDKMREILTEKTEYSRTFRDVSGKEERIVKLQVIRGADENHAAFGFIDITDEINSQNERARDAEEYRKLIESVAASYDVAYAVDMSDDSYRLLKEESDILDNGGKFRNYTESKNELIGIIHPSDRKRMTYEMDYGTIRENLKKTRSYNREFRVVIGGTTSWHEMNVTKIDADRIALGFAERDTDLTKIRLEEKRYEEYFALFVIDVDLGTMKAVINQEKYKSIPVGSSVPYTASIRKFASTLGREAEEYFMEMSDVRYLREEFAKDDKRTFSYKSVNLEGDRWIDVTSYVILRHDDGTPAMISLGFSFIDALATVRNELQSRLTGDMQMIGGLASGYYALYYINIDEGLFKVYALDGKKLPKAADIVGKGGKPEDIFKRFSESELIHPEDRYLFRDITLDVMRERLEHSKEFTVRFRRNFDGTYKWCEMDFIKYENTDERANAIAIGFADRDSVIRSEQAINSSFDVLGQEINPEEAIGRILSIAGEFYGAERCYIFEYTGGADTCKNTYEWCAEGTEPMISLLQDVPMDAVEGWNRQFRQFGAFHMDALDSEHNTEEGKAILEMQGIESLVAAPLMNGDRIVGFIGVDNPTKAKSDTDILKKAATVTFSEILKRNENDEEHVTLGKLADAFLSVYYVNLANDYMHTWKIADEYRDAYGAVQNYSVSMGGYLKQFIAENDRDRCIRMMSPEYILEQFESKDKFSVDFTDTMLGYDRNVVFDVIKVSEDGNRFVVCSRDVTETLAKEKEQHKLLEDALKDADSANQSKTDFLFNMSHDIRTPMNAITGFTNMAIKHIDDKERVLDSLSKIQQSGSMLLSLINSVLEVSRIESGHATLEEQPGDVYYSFANIESAMKQLAKAKNIELTYEFGNIDNRYVYADFNRCMRVFTNIISNAVKYTNAGGYVKVRCEQTKEKREGYGYYKYTIEDNGIGMSEEFQKHVFEQFTRENTATVSGIQGTGLGMSVVKSFVDLMGGKVSVKSTQGKGSTFTVILPFRLQEEERYTDPVTGEIVSRYGSAEVVENLDFTGKTVLLVEDNELNREIAVDILEEQGFMVEQADDGTVAVDILREKGGDYYDFILMDIQMPVMNGYDATREIRKMYPDAKLPVIALSANAFAEDKKASLEAGMNDHVAKPINTKELFAVLAKYM